MSLRINIRDVNLKDVGFDINGDMILAYNGVLFTGIEEEYYPDIPQQLWGETEYQNGLMLGIRRKYHPNGQMQLEYTKGVGGLHGPWKEWDINGNLVVDSSFIEDVKE